MRAEADGHGTVAVRVDLDPAAVAAVGDLRREVRTADLTRAGWTVGFLPPTGAARAVTASRRFGSPEEATAVLRTLAADGPFRGLALTQERSVLRTRTRFTGEVDLRGGLDAFGDDGLLRLTGSRAGFPSPGDGKPAQEVDFEIRADLPGAGSPSVWRARLGGRAALEAEAASINALGIGAAIVFVVSAVALAALLIRRVRPRGDPEGP